MGFGSYDESEQENQEYSAEADEEEAIQTEENAHAGEVNFEFETSNDDLLDRLQDIKDE